MSEADARRLADEWLANQRFAVELQTGRCVSTDKSWIFETRHVSGEVVFGNSPLVVRKADGRVWPCLAAWREFATELDPFGRAKRWWHRRLTY